MKQTGTCPKCQSQDIIRIPGRVGSYGSGNNIYTGWLQYVKVTRYLCGACGFSEEWVDEKSDIEWLKKKFGSTT